MEQHIVSEILPIRVVSQVNPNTSLAETLGVTPIGVGLGALPASLTTAIAGTCRVTSAFFNNTQGTSQTVTFQDANGNAAVGPSFVIPPLSNLLINFNNLIFWGGVKWSGSTGTMGSIVAYQ